MSLELQQLQNITPAKLPKWFGPCVLRYYVLVHDAVDGDNSKAETTFSAMKQTYGDSNCFFLQMNSRPPGQSEDQSHLPDPWSQFLIRQLDSQVQMTVRKGVLCPGRGKKSESITSWIFIWVLFQKCELMILFDDKINNYSDDPVLLEASAKKQVTLGIAGFLDFFCCLVLQIERCLHHQVRGCVGTY